MSFCHLANLPVYGAVSHLLIRHCKTDKIIESLRKSIFNNEIAISNLICFNVGRAVIDDGSLATSIRRGFPFYDCMSWWLRGRARAWVWGGPWFESGRWRSSFYFFYFLFLGVILSAECIGDDLNHLNLYQAAVSMVSVGTIINVVSGLSHSYRDLKIDT